MGSFRNTNGTVPSLWLGIPCCTWSRARRPLDHDLGEVIGIARASRSRGQIATQGLHNASMYGAVEASQLCKPNADWASPLGAPTLPGCGLRPEAVRCVAACRFRLKAGSACVGANALQSSQTSRPSTVWPGNIAASRFTRFAHLRAKDVFSCS